MKILYSAFYRAGNTSGKWSYPTLKEAMDSIKHICKENCPKGSKGYWEISKGNDLVKQGTIRT